MKPLIVCDQCNGTGWIRAGIRCGCSEDPAAAARQRFRVIQGGRPATIEVEVDRRPGFLSRGKKIRETKENPR